MLDLEAIWDSELADQEWLEIAKTEFILMTRTLGGVNSNGIFNLYCSKRLPNSLSCSRKINHKGPCKALIWQVKYTTQHFGNSALINSMPYTLEVVEKSWPAYPKVIQPINSGDILVGGYIQEYQVITDYKVTITTST